MKLKLKNIYQTSRVSIKHNNLDLTFDSEINNESEYPFFYENGFSFLFEIEKAAAPKKYKGIINGKEKTK
jgi:hypothetical protein